MTDGPGAFSYKKHKGANSYKNYKGENFYKMIPLILETGAYLANGHA